MGLHQRPEFTPKPTINKIPPFQGDKKRLLKNRVVIKKLEMKKVLFGFLILFCTVTSLIAKNPVTPITPETALQAFLHNTDKSFKWEVKEKLKNC